MDISKENLLKETYQQLMEVALNNRFPLNGIDKLVENDVMGFGTTIDEKIFSLKGFIDLLKTQREQSKGYEVHWNFKPLLRKITADKNTAVFADDLVFTLKMNPQIIKMEMRFTSIFEYKDNVWKLIHWHGSKPENTESETNTYGINLWKQKNAELEKIVKARTAELLEKNRELEIEAALEKVRSRAMTMNKSEELADLSFELVKQVQGLGVETWFCAFNIYDNDEEGSLEWGSNAEGTYPMYRTPREGIFLRYYEAGQNGETFLVNEIGEDECPAHYEYLCSLPGVGDQLRKIRDAGIPFPASQIDHVAFFKYGYILFITYKKVPQSHDIFKRFAKVFEQSYTRFLDLQRAEAQGREAQVEAALEKVRAQGMAMHSTSQLQEVVNTLAQQFHNIKMDITGVFIAIPNQEVDKEFTFWGSSGVAETYLKKATIPFLDRPIYTVLAKAIKKNKGFFTEEYTREEKIEFFEHMFKIPPFNASSSEWKEQVLAREGGYTRSVVVSNYTTIFVVNHNGRKLPDSDNEILKRFGKIFEQSYIRFRDLQKAEAQAREAHIETALEKVRSRTMGMLHSDELQDAALLLFQQVEALGVQEFGCGFNIWDEDRKHTTSWMAGKDRLQPSFKTSSSEDIFLRIRKAAERGDSLFVEEQSGKDLVEHYKYMTSIPIFKEITQKMKSKGLSFPKTQIMHCAYFSQGYLMFITYEPVPKAHDIFKRFAKVFEQTYTRFLDLQKAEEQTREAQIATALERVRNRTLAMQRSDELSETSIVVFKQLIELGIEPNRLFIGIINEVSNKIETMATNEEGTRITNRFIIDPKKNDSINIMYKGWKQKKKSITIHMEGKVLKDYVHYLTNEKKIPFKGGLSQKKRIQYLAFFSRGFIGIASPDNQPKETLELLERFAAVFNLTFTRYNDLKISEVHAVKAKEDLKKLKTEKKKAEATLTELKSTQSQLIQAEKMASLGELTAGIAHEIQNPLNFVNNFSEVSNEMIKEIQDERAKSKIERNEALQDELLEDISRNLVRISDHGKRADNIVKGMLQHSRKSTAEKEPTNINKLTEEYLKLAYHGLRAKDKSFNTRLKTDFDNTIGNINIIPQDFGRVILNILSNAFYAVNEKKQQFKVGFEPTISICTLKNDQNVEIRIKDNGNGIPKKVLNKIFHPFFTTKPTGQGTGLGLSMSYDIVTKGHGGTLKVTTEIGSYTEFKILLPITNTAS